MDAAEARSRLERMVAFDVDPTLTTGEVDDLFADCARPDSAGNLPGNVSGAAAWASGTITVGTIVKGGTARWWVCVVAGVTGGTEPSWPDLSGSARTRATVADGGVVWCDAGGPWTPTYNLHAGASAGWELKAAKASDRFDFATGDQDFKRRQVWASCIDMAERYRKRTPLTVVLS